jgi:hypothetical protein
VLHALLEAWQPSILKHFQPIQAEFNLKLTQTLQDTIKDAVTVALCSQPPPPVPKAYHKIPDTPRTSLDTGKGKYREFSIPTKLGSADHSESSKKLVKFESPTRGTHLSRAGQPVTLWSLYPATRPLLSRSNTHLFTSYHVYTTCLTSRNRGGRRTEENGAVCRAGWLHFFRPPSTGQ